jgi:hypothetical protein
MHGAKPPLTQFPFMAWCSVGVQGQLYIYLYLPISVDAVQTLRLKLVLYIDLRINEPVIEMFMAGDGNFSLRHRVHDGCGAHPASYPMCTRGSFPGGKAAVREDDLSPPSSAEVKKMWSYTSLPQ